jgi:hypothetical protein
MKENEKDAIYEIQELILAIAAVAKKYDIEDSFISCVAVGFLDMDSAYIDEEGQERANMNLLSSFSVTDEEELDDLLSYCVEAYRQENEPDPSSIEYWIDLARRNGDIN